MPAFGLKRTCRLRRKCPLMTQSDIDRPFNALELIRTPYRCVSLSWYDAMF